MLQYEDIQWPQWGGDEGSQSEVFIFRMDDSKSSNVNWKVWIATSTIRKTTMYQLSISLLSLPIYQHSLPSSLLSLPPSVLLPPPWLFWPPHSQIHLSTHFLCRILCDWTNVLLCHSYGRFYRISSSNIRNREWVGLRLFVHWTCYFWYISSNKRVKQVN